MTKDKLNADEPVKSNASCRALNLVPASELLSS